MRVQTDAAANCKDVAAHGGATQECLRTHRPLLTWNCQEQLFRQEVENADDLRLSTRLFKACLEDKKKVPVFACYPEHHPVPVRLRAQLFQLQPQKQPGRCCSVFSHTGSDVGRMCLRTLMCWGQPLREPTSAGLSKAV